MRHPRFFLVAFALTAVVIAPVAAATGLQRVSPEV